MILCEITLEDTGLNDYERKVTRDRMVGGGVTGNL